MPQTDEALPPRSLVLLQQELARKGIHIAFCTGAATVVWLAPLHACRIAFCAAAALAITIDLARLRSPGLHRFMSRLFHPLLRVRESGRVTGATMLAIGIALAVLLFPRAFAVAGLLYAGLADSAGALVGRAFGRHPFPGGRTAEGSLAFLLAAILAGWLIPGVALPAAVLAALPVTLLEAAPLPLDDNLFIPVAGAAAVLLAASLP